MTKDNEKLFDDRDCCIFTDNNNNRYYSQEGYGKNANNLHFMVTYDGVVYVLTQGEWDDAVSKHAHAKWI